MKVEIRYSIEVSNIIDLTPEQYRDLRSNSDRHPEIFPENSYSRTTKIIEGKEEFVRFLLDRLQKHE